MIGMRCRSGRRKGRPVYPTNEPRRSRAAGVRLLTARGLVGLATRFLRMVERAYRAGYLDLAHVEYSVRVSAKLRGRAYRLVGTKARNAPSASAAGRIPPKVVPLV
jgi:hypothetical protein